MNKKTEFTTIKIYTPTAKRLKSYMKRNGGVMAAWASIALDEAISIEKADKKYIAAAKKKGDFVTWEAVLNNIEAVNQSRPKKKV